jgi:uncharacterized membrane protein (DUF4010 family)
MIHAVLPFSDIVNQLWFKFLLVAFLAFIVGLEFREYLSGRAEHLAIGSARTYAFVSIFGFVLYSLDPTFRLFMAGLLFLTVLFGLFYQRKLQTEQLGILQLLIGVIVYTFGPMSQLMPLWFLVLVFVALIFVLSARPLTHRLMEQMAQEELITLAKFLLLSAVILPLLPKELVAPEIPASPFSIWLAVVIVSSISYSGYILRRYVFPNKGYLITGIVGGLYSSTATTVVLSKKCRGSAVPNRTLHSAMLAASGMMYFRLLLLVSLLGTSILPYVGIPLFVLGIGTLLAAVYFAKFGDQESISQSDPSIGNPLEFGTAFLFAVIFLLMLVLTRIISQSFGASGLELLSFGVGFTDIDPFVLSLLNGTYHSINTNELAGALLIAAGSNNLLKGTYAVVIGNWQANRSVLMALYALGFMTMGYGLTLF